MLTDARYLQLIFARETLIAAVNERWRGDTKHDKLKRAVVCSCLKHALVQVSACTSSGQLD